MLLIHERRDFCHQAGMLTQPRAMQCSITVACCVVMWHGIIWSCTVSSCWASGLVFQTVVWCCSNGDVQDAPLATRASSSSSGEQEPHSVQGEPQAHTAQQQQQQQQQQAPSLSSVTAPQPGSQSVQQLTSRSAAEGLMRVNSPGPAHPFDAAAYAAAAAARTSSPGQLALLLMWFIPLAWPHLDTRTQEWSLNKLMQVWQGRLVHMVVLQKLHVREP